LLEQDDDDDGYYYNRKIPSSTMIASEWLAQNCYIDIYAAVHGYNDYYNNRSK
jgi:hypothetical protein